MNFTVEHLEFYLLVLVRISAFIMAAPFFGYNNIPMKVKLSFSVLLTFIVVNLVGVTPLEYSGTIGYAVLIVKEAVVGIAIGYIANLCLYIVSFAGQLIDMDLGFSMVNMFDPLTQTQGTITGTLYTYLVMLVMIVTNLHYYVLRAIIDSFQYFTVGKAVFSVGVKDVMVDFMPNYFIIGFRIVLPVFGTMLLVNVILGVLSRAAPQMNMFVVGMQLKVLIGLLVLLLIVETIPGVTNFIFEQMKIGMEQMIRAFTPK